MRSAIQCFCNRVVVESRGFPSNGSYLLGVIRQYAIQDEVNIKKSSMLRFETYQSLKNHFNLKVSSWSFTIFKEEFAIVQVTTIDKYSLCGSGWKG